MNDIPKNCPFCGMGFRKIVLAKNAEREVDRWIHDDLPEGKRCFLLDHYPLNHLYLDDCEMEKWNNRHE